MKLHWSPRSPFVRKVMIAAHELGLADRLDCVRTVVATTRPHALLMEENPLSKIPTLVLDDGTVLYDSPVICEYLDGLHDGPKLIPAVLPARMTALRRQALGDGFLDFLLLWRNERERPAEHQSQVHLSTYAEKRKAIPSASTRRPARARRQRHSRSGTSRSAARSPISDFRFAAEDWRGGHPRIAAWHATFAARPSVRATDPVDDS